MSCSRRGTALDWGVLWAYDGASSSFPPLLVEATLAVNEANSPDHGQFESHTASAPLDSPAIVRRVSRYGTCGALESTA